MKKLLALVLLVLVVFAVLNRSRIYVRDPLASVTRDGAAESGVQVFIDYNNDVLLEHDDFPRYLTLVQHDRPVGAPKSMHCLHFLACMMDEAVEPVLIVSQSARVESMTDKSVAFRDDKNREALVTLH